MKKKMNTVVVTKAVLRDSLQTNALWEGKYLIPFAKSKGQWLLKNDRIEDDDIVACLAYEDDTLVCFVYLIPDLINTPNGIEKVFWSDKWWVSNEHKNTVLAAYLKNEVAKITNNRLVIKFLGKDTEAYYAKQPYVKFGERKRFFIIYNLDAGLLINKLRVLRFVKYPLISISNFSLKLIKALNYRKAKLKTRNIHYQYLNKLDEASWMFIEKHCEKDLVPKTKDYIDWQLSNTQYTNTPIQQKYVSNCLIAGAFSNINAISFSIVENDEIIGFISYLERESEFIVKYFITTAHYWDKCIAVLMEHFVKSGSRIIYTENESLGENILKNYYKVFSSERILHSLIHKSFNFDSNNLLVKEHDGHFS